MRDPNHAGMISSREMTSEAKEKDGNATIMISMKTTVQSLQQRWGAKLT